MPRFRSGACRLFALIFALATLVLSAVVPASAQTSVSIHDVMTALPGGPYLGQSVSTSGIVVGVLSTGGFYISEPSADWDSLRSTAEGMPVFSSTVTACNGVVDGDVVTVVGTVSNTTVLTAADTPGTGIQPTSCTKTGTAAMTQSIDLANFGALTSFGDALQYTGMAATDKSFVAIGPTSGTLGTTAVTSTGQFWAVLSSGITTNNHLFRSAGIAADEYKPSTAPAAVPTWSGNPQRILIDTTTFGGTAVNITVGQTITCTNSNTTALGATAGIGLIDYTLGYARLLIFKETTCSVSGTIATSVSAAADTTHFKVGTLDVNTFLGGTSLFTTALSKATLAVTGVFGSPDIFALQQVGNQSTLGELATAANTANGGTTTYTATVLGTDTVNSGFLINTATLKNPTYTEVGRATTYTTASGSTAALWEHPPLVFTGEFVRTGKNYPVTVLNVYLTPRDNIGDTTLGPDIRVHRAAQAAAISAMVQGYQTAGANVIVAGNFNGYEFNDGYVDVTGIIDGAPAAATAVTLYQATSTTAALTDFTTQVTADTRYNVIERGNAASLEHILASATVTDSTTASASLASYINTVTQPHFTTDYAAVDANDATTPAGLTPHDGFLVNFAIPPVPTTATLTPSTLNFGDVSIGGKSSLVLTFTNTSSYATNVNVTNIAISGTNATDFTETSTCAAVAQNATCTVTVTFAPTAVGTRTGLITVTSDSTSNPTLTASLTGIGVATSATLTPTSAAFANTYAGGGVSATKTFTVTNTSLIPITVGSAVTSTNFKVTANNCSTLAVGASCTVLVAFTPTTAGALTGTLTVTTNTTADPTLTANLTGTGLATTATLTPSTAAFGNVVVGSTSAAQSFVYTNTSSIPLTVSAATATGDYKVATNTCTTVAAGATCTIGVTFTPTVLGTRTGTLTVTNSASANPTLTSTLTGRGVADVESNVASLNFGAVDVGAHSAAQVVTVTNYTSAAIALTGITLTGDYASTTTCGTVLKGLSTCTITIVFTPTAVGTRTGVLTVTTSDTKYPVITVALTGNGADFSLAMLPATGTVIAGATGTAPVVTATPLGGYSAALTLTCTFETVASTCTLPNPTFTLSSTAVTQKLAITTTSEYDVVGYYGMVAGLRGTGLLLTLLGLGASALLFTTRRRHNLPARLLLGLATLLLLSSGLSGCSSKYPARNSPYTEPGVYTYTVSATDGTLTHTATYTLTVKSH